jgi:hypothetical protein
MRFPCTLSRSPQVDLNVKIPGRNHQRRPEPPRTEFVRFARDAVHAVPSSGHKAGDLVVR